MSAQKGKNLSTPAGQNSAEQVWKQYLAGCRYHAQLGLQQTVERNQNFYIGRQWEGVNAPDLDKPVLNFLGRVVSYFVASVTSSGIGVSCTPFNAVSDDETRAEMRIIAAQLRQVIEDNDLNNRAKDLILDAAVNGDACLHLYFDPDAATGQRARGLVRAELLRNTDVFFGERQSAEVERQPYIIVASRVPVWQLRQRYGLDADALQGGADPFATELQRLDDTERVTVLTKYFRRGKTVWCTRCTAQRVLLPETDLGYRRYPLAWMNWDKVTDSYHGQAAITALIPNQIAVNKAYAMALKQQRDVAFQKILYNANVFPRGWSNRIGAVAVNGDPRQAAAVVNPGADVPASTFTMIDSLMGYTKALMGASDAALGSVNPQNTSAILAAQQATAVPLELKRRAFLQMMEDAVRAMLDIIAVDYGERWVCVEDELGGQRMERFDFGAIGERLFSLGVEVGAAAYWSEPLQAQQLERLWQSGIITDRALFLEQLPDGMVRGKQRLLARIREEEANRAMQNLQAGLPAAAPQGGRQRGV